MSGNSGVRLFIGDPQPVEIQHRGIWYSGELLGWTDAGEGQVLARVRCVVDGLRHSTWKDLTDLRLPDPAHPPRCETFPARPGSVTVAPDEDATRPHALLVGRSRPAKPEHAQTPPTVHGRPVNGPRPARVVRPAAHTNPNRRRSDELSPV